MEKEEEGGGGKGRGEEEEEGSCHLLIFSAAGCACCTLCVVYTVRATGLPLLTYPSLPPTPTPALALTLLSSRVALEHLGSWGRGMR